MKLESAVKKLTAISTCQRRSTVQRAPSGPRPFVSLRVTEEELGVTRDTRSLRMTERATTRLRTAAVASVPGSPHASTSQNPARSTPSEAPALLVKYSIERPRPG